MDWKMISAIWIGIGIIVLTINFLFFTYDPISFAILNILAAVFVLAMPIYVKYAEYTRTKRIEQLFPNFLRDLTENINAGMTLPQAIRATSENDYDILTKYVRDMRAKIDWGIPFESCLNDFASKTKSKIIKRTIKGIVETHNSGGAIGTVMLAITNYVEELERIKKERSVRIYSQMVTGYFIFFLFLGIMFALSKLIIPAFSWESVAGIENVRRFYAETFRNLAVVQGIFSGLGIGKMAEGSIVAGFKHSFVLAVIGYTVLIF